MPQQYVKQSSDFARRKAARPPMHYSRGILIASIIVSLLAGVMLFFVKPHFIIGAVLLVLLLAVVIKYPVAGLYLYMLIVYLRPQDLMPMLAYLRPNIFVLAVTIISLVMHRKMENRAHVKLLPNDKMFLAFLVAAVLSNLTSIWFRSSVGTTIELMKLSVFYFAAVMLLDTPRRIVTYMILYMLSMGFVSLVQIWTYLTVGLTRTTGSGGYGIIIGGSTILGGGGPLQLSSQGVNGVGGYSTYFLANASELGLALCVTYPLCWFLARGTKSKLLKFVSLALMGVFIVSIIFTGSRGAFVGLLATLLYILYKEKKLLIGLIILLILSPLAVYALSDRYIDRIESIADYEADESVGIRLRLWDAAVDMVADYPVFGVGTGNFPNAYGAEYRPQGSASLYWSPHNIFVQIVTEMGLVGFAIYLTFIGSIFLINKKTRNLLATFDGSRMLYRLTLAIDVMLFGYIVAGQFITATYYPHLFQFSAWAAAIYLMVFNKATSLTGGQSGGDAR